jgi:arsenate reductase (glutaredoxin)
VVLQILPWFDQANIEALAVAVPVHLALAWVVYRLAGGARRGRGARASRTGAQTARPRQGRCAGTVPVGADPVQAPAMEVQIFGTRKCKDTQKAVRFFKERRVRIHQVDLNERRRLSRRAAALRAEVRAPRRLLDREGKRFRDRGLQVAHIPPARILGMLVDDPLLLKTPLVRFGNQLTIGAAEATWREWVK